MDIALASDNNYVQHMAVAIESIIENNINEEINFHIMNNGIDLINIERIKSQIESKNKNAFFYDFSNLENEVGFKSHSNVLPISAYSRIFLPPILKTKTDRLIYMDVDMVCCSPLSDIYHINLKNNIIAAVQDFADEKARLGNGLDLNARYVNSGFMLIDIKRWVEEDITNKLHNYILDREGTVIQEDQGAINSVLRNRIMIIHPKYNAMTPFFFTKSKEIKEKFDIPVYYTDKEIIEAKKNPVIIHYLKYNGLINRPWEQNCIHPLKKTYHFYLEKTAWAGTALLSDKRSALQRIKCNYQLKCPWNIKKIIIRLRKYKLT